MIQVRGLSKTYKIFPRPWAVFRELLLGVPSHDAKVALENLSFELENGGSLGVIGDNGAGKSTLLKLLTGTTLPTSGSCLVEGKVSALLELGAGFHPEFSGRENIYFSGALLSRSRKEVRQREAAIIEFSELGAVIDQPVKTYSTGMYVRLGFSVATGFDPSLLIIDEALSVGDQGFQKKCTDRIVELTERGATLLFCSHNLHQVRTLCERALWLDRGQVKALGPAVEVVDRYQDFCWSRQRDTSREAALGRTAVSRVISAHLDPSEAGGHRFLPGEKLAIEITAEFKSGYPGTPALGVSIVRSDGVVVHTALSSMDGCRLQLGADQRCSVRLEYVDLPLLSGSYSFTVFTTDQDHLQAYDTREQMEPFSILGKGGAILGLIKLSHRWLPGRSLPERGLSPEEPGEGPTGL